MSEIREFAADLFEFDRYEHGHYSQPFGSPIVLALASGHGYNRHYGVGGWTAEGEGRIVDHGPKVQGPHAYAFQHASVISAHRQAPKLEIPVQDGDLLRIVGTLYRVRVVRREFIKLDRVED